MGQAEAVAGLRMRKDKIEPRAPFAHADLEALAASIQTARERAVLLLFVGGIIRRSELLAIRAEDVHWQRGMILIRGKGERERWIAPGDAAMMALRASVNGQRRGRLFPFGRTSLYRMLEDLSARAGVSQVYPHRFRTTGICWLLDQGVDLISVSVIAGHASVNETRRYQRAVEAQRALAAQARLSLADRL